MSDNPAPVTQEHLVFHGEGQEYFRIWIVNLFLTIITLGVYSAWAKVRTNKYFYGSTELAGDRFDYLADPLMILKGRLIAVAALILYVTVQTFLPVVFIFVFLAALAVLPWIIMRSLRFRAMMTSWRGIRFGFAGDVRGAAIAYLAWPLFAVLTLGIGLPYAWYKQNQYVINHYQFGRSQAHSTTTGGDFYVIAFIIMGIALGAGLLMMLVSVLGVFVTEVATVTPEVVQNESLEVEIDTDQAAFNLGVATSVVFGIYFLSYLGIYAAYQALRYSLIYNNIEIAGNRTANSVSVFSWVMIVVANMLLMVVTLGLYYPWARVRLTRYFIGQTRVDAVDLDGFVADEAAVTNALGEEVGEVFDLGIGI